MINKYESNKMDDWTTKGSKCLFGFETMWHDNREIELIETKSK